MRAGQSAVEIKNLSRGIVTSGGFAELNCGQSAILERTVRHIDLKLSREVVDPSGSAKLNCGRSAIWVADSPQDISFWV